jgi:FKBP-type peptidyl-prolyl cis-trans isomerase
MNLKSFNKKRAVFGLMLLIGWMAPQSRLFAEDKEGGAAEAVSEKQDEASEAKAEKKIEKKEIKAKTKTKAEAGSKAPAWAKDVKVGKGAPAKKGDVLEVNYLGKLTDGKKFDSSYDRKQTFKFKLGEDQVIQGWHQGFMGMKKGGKRILTIPPELGYGAQGAGGVIPPNATLVFEVELVNINPKS